MPAMDILNIEAEKVGEASLRDDVFSVEPRPHLLHFVLRAQLAARRTGSACTKTRSEVKVVRKPKQKAKSRPRKTAQAVAKNVHQMPAGGRRRTQPAEEPVAFPNVPTIVANAARAAIAADSSNRIMHWNDAAIELFGFTAEEVIGRNLQRVIQARDVHGNRLSADHGSLHEMIRIGEAPQSFELAIITATGKMIRVAVSVVVVLGPQAGECAMVYLMTPMHRRRRADEAIDRLLAQTNLMQGAAGIGLWLLNLDAFEQGETLHIVLPDSPFFP